MKVKTDAVKNLILLGLLEVAIAIPCTSQQPVPVFPPSMDHTFHDEAPVDKNPLIFSSRAEYVLVPVVVRDKNRQDVKGLSKDDFTLLENGKQQKISSIEEVQTETSPIRRATAGNEEFSNSLESGTQSRRITIIALDLINTPLQDQAMARRSVIKLLSHSVDEGSLIELLTIHNKGITLVHDFTDDPKVLLQALRTVNGVLSSNELTKNGANAKDVQKSLESTGATSAALTGVANQALAGPIARMIEFTLGADRQYAAFQRDAAIQDTLSAFQRIAQSVASIPGRKSLVWVTGSFPFTIDSASSEITGGGTYGMFERTMQVLNSANVSMYPVDARGLVALGVSAESNDFKVGDNHSLETAFNQNAKDHAATLETMTSIAEMTGGKAFFNRNDIDNSVSEAMQDGTHYYVLTYPLNKTNTQAGWRKLTVKCKGDGYKIRARRGFFLTRATVDQFESKQPDLSNALDSPLDFTALPIKAKWLGTPVESKNGRIITFQLELPANAISPVESENRLSLDFRVRANNTKGEASGNVAQTFEGTLPPGGAEQLKKEGVKYKSSFELVPGEYTVHFVVRDNVTGKVGSLVTHLKVS